MRNNQPITQREVVMGDAMMIVSKTDLKGKIEFINEDFLEIAGFTKEQLIGEPHNIIRHPDMPVEAFEDMWRDLKAGLPWCGYVKNRVSNGDHYWVLANAMPLVEGGQTTGYISIRSKPNGEEVKAVEKIYHDFKTGKANGRSIVHGRVMEDSRNARIARWFERLSNKISCVATALCLLILLVGGIGMYVASKEKTALTDLYQNRLIPTANLAEMSRLTYENVVNLGVLISDKELDATAMKAEMTKNSEEITRLLTEYQNTETSAKEDELIEKYIAARQKFLEQVIMPVRQLVAEEKRDEAQVLYEKGLPLFKEVAMLNDGLVEFQLKVTDEEYQEATIVSQIGFWLSIAVIIGGLFAAFLLSKFLGRVLISKLDYLNSRLSSITGGNLNTDIKVGNDELAGIMTSVKALQAKIAYGESEKKQLDKDKKAMQEKLANDFEDSVKSIVNVVASAATELSQTATGMVSNVRGTSQKADSASVAATTTTENVQSVAAAAEELSASVAEISAQLQKNI